MNIEQIRANKPVGAVGYGIGRITGEPFYVNSQGLVWSKVYNEWTGFTHNIEIKTL